jgi:DNA polymerase I
MSALPTLHLIDASMYVFRAYYSVAADMFDHEQQPVHAVYGFLGFLLALMTEARPSHIVIAFDESLTTSFRNQIYPQYKANRELPPPDLDRQFVYCRELVDAIGLARLSHHEYEADDLIGSMLMHARSAGFRSVIVSGDKDLCQLLGEHDHVWDYAKRERLNCDGVFGRMGVRPEQVVDYLALTGDSVDNIPGVPGIGPKTAAALLAHFGSLDAILARVDEISYLRSLRGAASVAAKLRTHREAALLARRLTAIALEVPLPLQIEQLKPAKPDPARVDDLLERLRFGPFTRRRVLEYVERYGT